MQKKRINPWSMVAALCAVGLCPLFSIAAIFAGFRALIEIKARGDTRGARLAFVSILAGAIISGLWGGGMLWWNMNVRSMIEHGPIDAMMQGQDGNVEDFLAAFTSKTTPEKASEFLHDLHVQYGVLQGGHLDSDIEESPVDGSNLFLGMVPMEAELSYVLLFDTGKIVRLKAQYELFHQGIDGNTFMNRFVWMKIHDEDGDNLVYPAQAVENLIQHGK